MAFYEILKNLLSTYAVPVTFYVLGIFFWEDLLLLVYVSMFDFCLEV